MLIFGKSKMEKERIFTVRVKESGTLMMFDLNIFKIGLVLKDQLDCIIRNSMFLLQASSLDVSDNTLYASRDTHVFPGIE